MRNKLNTTLTGVAILFALITGIVADINAKPINIEINRIDDNRLITNIADIRTVDNVAILRIGAEQNVINRGDQIISDAITRMPQITETARTVMIDETTNPVDLTISTSLEIVRIGGLVTRIEEIDDINPIVGLNLIANNRT